MTTTNDALRTAREALEPFATFGAENEDGGDIRAGLMRDRVCDWFGPSDFDAARSALDKIDAALVEEAKQLAHWPNGPDEKPVTSRMIAIDIVDSAAGYTSAAPAHIALLDAAQKKIEAFASGMIAADRELHQRGDARAVERAPLPTFQARVEPWLLHCFGPEIAADRTERNHRFLEEALELVQSGGCTASEAHQLVDYVFNRPVGEMPQEVGGVMNTLAALCLAHGLDMHEAGEVELRRVWEKADTIREKQRNKPKHSPLAEQTPPLRHTPTERLTLTTAMLALNDALALLDPRVRSVAGLVMRWMEEERDVVGTGEV